MKNNKNNQGGFTAIELLFVILFIGLLVLVSISFLNTSRRKARDAKRLVDIRRIQTALEFYKLEYSTYPVFDKPIILGGNNFIQICDDTSGAIVDIQTQCQNVFMAPVPKDPSTDKSYIYIGDKDGYTIGFETEDDTVLGGSREYYAHPESTNTNPQIQ